MVAPGCHLRDLADQTTGPDGLQRPRTTCTVRCLPQHQQRRKDATRGNFADQSVPDKNTCASRLQADAIWQSTSSPLRPQGRQRLTQERSLSNSADPDAFLIKLSRCPPNPLPRTEPRKFTSLIRSEANSLAIRVKARILRRDRNSRSPCPGTRDILALDSRPVSAGVPNPVRPGQTDVDIHSDIAALAVIMGDADRARRRYHRRYRRQ